MVRAISPFATTPPAAYTLLPFLADASTQTAGAASPEEQANQQSNKENVASDGSLTAAIKA